jgi:cytochrome c peroxidase
MMKRTVFSLAVLFVAFRASDTLHIRLPKQWPEPEQRLHLNSNTVLLGRLLFYDPVLSANNMVSCASCHSPYNSFAHTDHSLSHGIDDQVGFRNAPPLINLAWRKDFMWDGFATNMEQQIRFPIDHPKEMGSSFDSLPIKLSMAGGYGPFFNRAFGDEQITAPRILSALSQFLVSLVSSNSRYDQMKRGEVVFSQQESDGYRVFQQNCMNCHHEPLFTGNQYASNGLPVDSTLSDYGRMRVTGDPMDSIRFRVPTLRNIEYTYPYMHDGRFHSLWQVLDHYQKHFQSNANETDASTHTGLTALTAQSKVDLMAFLLTLSDKEFIFGNQHGYPMDAIREKNQTQSPNTY